jgi:prefoldin subunit 5
MGITIAIVAGVILSTAVAGYFDYLGKKAKNVAPDLERKIENMEKRLNQLDAMLTEKNERMKQLEEEVSFVNRLLEKKD